MRVVTLRSYHSIPVHHASHTAREGCLTLEAAAQQLKVSPTVVRKLITRGTLPARQIVPTTPWIIRTDDLARENVQRYVAAIHSGKSSPPTDDAAQLTLTES